MVKPEQMKHGRMNVIDLSGTGPIQRLVSPCVTFTISSSAPNPATRQPVRKNVRIVIAPLSALGRRHPAKFSRPQNDRVVQQPALLQVLNQRRRAPRESHRQRPMIPAHILMRVPIPPGKTVVVAGPDLDKADAAFDQPPSNQALPPEVIHFFARIDFFRPLFCSLINTVEAEDVFGFA